MAQHYMKYGDREFCVNLEGGLMAAELHSNAVSLPKKSALEHINEALDNPIGSPKPVRVQGAFIADSEVEELTGYIKKQVEPPEYVEGITTCEAGAKGEEQDTLFDDELMEEAVRIIMETNQASASMLQRKFRIGYTRAARLIDTMEELKIIGPNVGSKPRDILMTYDQVCERYFNQQVKKQSSEDASEFD